MKAAWPGHPLRSRRMSPSPLADRNLKILYIEDRKEILDPLLQYIQEQWSPESKGARSNYSAMRLLEVDNFVPDLVIFDSEILGRDTDQVATPNAAQVLYRFLVK